MQVWQLVSATVFRVYAYMGNIERTEQNRNFINVYYLYIVAYTTQKTHTHKVTLDELWHDRSKYSKSYMGTIDRYCFNQRYMQSL